MRVRTCPLLHVHTHAQNESAHVYALTHKLAHIRQPARTWEHEHMHISTCMFARTPRHATPHHITPRHACHATPHKCSQAHTCAHMHARRHTLQHAHISACTHVSTYACTHTPMLMHARHTRPRHAMPHHAMPCYIKRVHACACAPNHASMHTRMSFSM